MKVVFADTFYYLALVNPADVRHPQALAYTATFQGRMVTTAWIVTELADALSDPSTRPAFLQVLTQLRADPDVTIVPPDTGPFEDGLRLFAARPDKEWSLTDCISFVVMQREGIIEALTGDRHFEQAGFVALLK
jgi:predicted nucleic acid-binding protein